MFGMFKRRETHESLSLQREDAIEGIDESLSDGLMAKILNGESCDRVPSGYGPFGSATNPIPVNGMLGEIKYLAKLRGATGLALMFHRVGSVSTPVISNPADRYEVVCLDGTQRGYLHFDLYHPRRSNLAPNGYSLVPVHKKLEMDLPYGFGCRHLVNPFPQALPDAIFKVYGESLGGALARQVRERLQRHNFSNDVTVYARDGQGKEVETTVSAAEFAAWEARGAVSKLEEVVVHFLTPDGYSERTWLIDRDIPAATAAKYRDPETGDLYAIVVYRSGEPETKIATKEAWEEVEAAMGGWKVSDL